ncbi:MAG: NUDIX hydrolase [Candidatus Omnitrophica bacterium]|nr:NUDIX hydrolase [Candidatus Omnitrophota bacterium]
MKPGETCRTISSEPVFDGQLLHVRVRKLEMPGGRIGHREVIEHPGAAVMLAMPDPEHVILVRQHRVAPDGWIYEIPAGTLDPGETPEQCACRELAEEIGFSPKRVKKVLEFYPSPGFNTEIMYLYLATELEPALAKLDEDEHLEPVRLSVKEALRMLDQGEIVDAKTLIALYWLARRNSL